MRSVRRGEAAYLELMREAKAQFDAEIARNKEKGKAGRPRKEVAPVVVEDDDIEIDFSDVVSAAEVEAEPVKAFVTAPAQTPVKVNEKKAAPARSAHARSGSGPAPKKAAAKKAAAKKAPAKKAPMKKVSVKKAPVKKAPIRKGR